MSTSTTPMTEPTEHEEPCAGALRIALGLRPTDYSWGESTIDPRPCPPWCHIGLNTNATHEIERETPFDAHHVLGTEPEVGLSLYPSSTWQPNHFTATSHVRVHLRQTGQNQPEITLATYIEPDRAHDTNLRLSLADARDLLAALSYVVAVADGERAVVEGTE